MFWFVTGFALGWAVGGWYQQSARGGVQVGQLQTRAKNALDESARIVEESKRELQSALQGSSKPAPRGRPRGRRPRKPTDGE